MDQITKFITFDMNILRVFVFEDFGLGLKGKVVTSFRSGEVSSGAIFIVSPEGLIYFSELAAPVIVSSKQIELDKIREYCTLHEIAFNPGVHSYIYTKTPATPLFFIFVIEKIMCCKMNPSEVNIDEIEIQYADERRQNPY